MQCNEDHMITTSTTVPGGTIISDQIIASGGYMTVSPNGAAHDIRVDSGGILFVSERGSAVNIIENGGCVLHYDRGNELLSFTPNTIRNVLFSSGDLITLHSGTVMDSVVMGGNLEIFSSGLMQNTTVSGGKVFIYAGGMAANNTIETSGSMYISSGGTAYGTENSGGWMRVSHGAAVSTTIGGDAVLYLTGGSAEGTVIQNGGRMVLYSDTADTVAQNTVVHSGGSMIISSGGSHRGELQIESGAVVSAESGTTIEFSVKDRTTADGFLISNLAQISGAPTYTITVSAEQAVGTYKLAQDAEKLYHAGITIGTDFFAPVFTLIVNRPALKCGNRYYALQQQEGDLSLVIADSDISIPNPAGIAVYSGNTVTFAGATAESRILSSGSDDRMEIFSGGTANSTTVKSLTGMYISNGGTATHTALSGGSIDTAVMYIYSGGLATDTKVTNRAALYVSGGSASATTVSAQYGESATVLVYDGGRVQDTTLTGVWTKRNYGTMQLLQNGSAYNTKVSSGGILYISGGTADTTMVRDFGSLHIFSGGIADNTSVSGYRETAEMTVSCGGLARNTTVVSNGDLDISSGGIASNSVLSGWSARMRVRDGGKADNTVVHYCCSMFIGSGGLAENTFLSGGFYGYARMYLTGTASATILNSCGEMIISSGGEAHSTTVNNYGRMYISSGGMANNTTVNNYGSMYIGYGGTGTEIIENGGYVEVAHGANVEFASNTINGLVLSDYANMTVHKNTVANNTTVNNYGRMYISSGGVHRGSLQMEAGAIVSAYEGAIIDFTVADRTAGDGCLINDLSRISGNPTYTITVSADQTSGSYKLAQGAENFTGTISIGTDGSNYGTLTVNGATLKYNGISCSLTQKNGELTLNIQSGSVINLSSDKNGVAFTGLSGNTHVVEFSKNKFTNVLALRIAGNAVDTYNLSAGTYQWQVDENKGDNIVSNNAAASEKFISDADGNLDLFFADADGVWGKGYAAKHQGSLNGWKGTGEQVELSGKNRIADVFAGSNDANVLVLSDDANGDALFVDDIYTTFGKDAARLAQIDEIRAGAGDDIVDMTSQQFAYIGDGVKIYGGLGNDTIWANNGNNALFGDAGNDRLVGGSDDDVIIGGIGNDRMHGGGGEDIFCFGENWGKDTVEQLAGGEITLWFEEGSTSNWNASTLTYTDGTNSVKVSGVSNDNITLIFGDDGSLRYDELVNSGCFEDAASEKIFEDKNKGMLA